jgi:hypothetical protein
MLAVAGRWRRFEKLGGVELECRLALFDLSRLKAIILDTNVVSEVPHQRKFDQLRPDELRRDYYLVDHTCAHLRPGHSPLAAVDLRFCGQGRSVWSRPGCRDEQLDRP